MIPGASKNTRKLGSLLERRWLVITFTAARIAALSIDALVQFKNTHSLSKTYSFHHSNYHTLSWIRVHTADIYIMSSI